MKFSRTLAFLLPVTLLAATPTLHADSFTTPGAATYNVATAGIYTVTVAGAAGGRDGAVGTLGGLGAILSGNFTFQSGTVLNLGIGAKGEDAFYGGGGGGGSIVTISGPGTLLLDAGGGGGGEYAGPGGNAVLTSGNGSDGAAAPTADASTGGGGYLGRGSTSGGSTAFLSGGGGGGYTGGNGAKGVGLTTGGSSYHDASTSAFSAVVSNTGNGYITITYVGPAANTAVTPEPSTLLLLSTGLTGFAGLVRRRSRKVSA